MDIDKLKEKFFNGETTIEEEFELRHILQDEQPADKHDADRELLLALLPQKSEPPAGLETSLSLFIDRAAGKTEPQMQPVEKRRDGAKRRIYTIPKMAWYTLSTAAAIALICLMNTGETKPKETFRDPKVAAAHIEETLALLATAFNTGIEKEQESIAQIGCLRTAIEEQINENIFK